jgi:hypothetical protein
MTPVTEVVVRLRERVVTAIIHHRLPARTVPEELREAQVWQLIQPVQEVRVRMAVVAIAEVVEEEGPEILVL